MSRRTIAALYVCGWLALCATISASAQGTARCQEDAPCWVWSRMGDHKRGVVDLRTNALVVVGPCAFRRLWMHGNARLWSQADRMRGDWWAIHHGCERTSAR